MKTKHINHALVIFSFSALVACSKLESNDMKFKQAISESQLSGSVLEGSDQPMPDPSVVEEAPKPTPSPVVVVVNPTPADMTSNTTTTNTNTNNTNTNSNTTTTTNNNNTTVTNNTNTNTNTTTTTNNTTTNNTTTNNTTTTTTTTTNTDDKTCHDDKDKVVEEKEVYYSEKDIPTCKLNIVHNGAGSASRVVVVSASKEDLMSGSWEGMDSLSSSEMSAMKDAVNKMVSGNGVQVLKNGDSFKKNGMKAGSKAMIVTDGKAAVDLSLNGLGKDAQIYVMNVSDKHNTVCLRINGVTDSSKVFVSAKGDPNYVSRASLDYNGSGAAQTYVKVLGGNQTGSDLQVNGFSDSDLKLITEGKNDTFSSIKANGVSKCSLDLRIKGKDHTGLGMSANGINSSKIHMELEGENDVKTLMAVNGMSNNDIDGWMKYKSAGKLDAHLADFIKVATIP